MAAPVVIVTGPAKGLVGGQSRHLDVLEAVAGRLNYRFVRIEIGRRAGESGLLLPWRLLGDYARFFAALHREIKAGASVMVHINSSVQYASLVRDFGFALIARLLRPSSQLVQIHGSELCDAQDRKPVLRALARLVSIVAGRLVVLSAVQARAIGGAALAGTVIPNAVEVRDQVDRVGAGRGPLRVLYLARMIPEKGVLICLDAISLLRDRGIRVELSLAGDGPLLDCLPLKIAELGLGDQVSVIGPVPAADVRPLLAAHDLLWAPSRYAEGQPYSLIEALEAGVPVLATAANPAMKEMIESGEGALIGVSAAAPDLAAATASIVEAPDELVHLRKVARSVAERRYSLDAAVPHWRTAWSVEPRHSAQLGAPAV